MLALDLSLPATGVRLFCGPMVERHGSLSRVRNDDNDVSLPCHFFLTYLLTWNRLKVCG